MSYDVSVIEQKRRTIDQGPSDVLSGGQPPQSSLLNRHFQIVPQANESWVGLDRTFGKFELVAQRRQSWIRRQRCLTRVYGGGFLTQFRVDRAQISREQGPLRVQYELRVSWQGLHGTLLAG